MLKYKISLILVSTLLFAAGEATPTPGLNICNDQPGLIMKGKKMFDCHPLALKYLSNESGGDLNAEEAYSDGIGVFLVESPYATDGLDYSVLNYLVKKYGEITKDYEGTLKDYVLKNGTDEDIELAKLLEIGINSDTESPGIESPDIESSELVFFNGVLYCNGAEPGNEIKIEETTNGVSPGTYYIASEASDIREKIKSGFIANNICTSHVTNMFRLFKYEAFNDSISSWDTSNVTNMVEMFQDAYFFNQPLNFDTSNVTYMNYMFRGATSFNQPLKFDTSNVTLMRGMFRDAKYFNQPLNFDTSKVTDMFGMFREANLFNQELNFDTSNVTDMKEMFWNATSFNQPLNFDTSNVTDMFGMFLNAKSFSQNISSWCVSKISLAPNGFDSGSKFQGQSGLQPKWGTCP